MTEQDLDEFHFICLCEELCMSYITVLRDEHKSLIFSPLVQNHVQIFFPCVMLKYSLTLVLQTFPFCYVFTLKKTN